MQEKDREIIDLLQKNCRINPEQIAVMLELEVAYVVERIEKLEKEGIIVKYHTLVNWEKTGEEFVSALIEVKVSPQRGSGFDNIAERIYRFPEVKAVYLMSGGFDFSVLIEGKTMKEVALFVGTKLATIDNVQSTATHFVLKKYKQEGVILDDQEKDHRLVITP